MIEVIWDHQIFSLQRFGGATRYFKNLANSLLLNRNVEIQLQLGLYDRDHAPKSIESCIRGVPGSIFVPRHGVLRFSINELFSYYYKLTPRIRNVPTIHHCTYIYPTHIKASTPLVVTHHDCTLEKFPKQFRRANFTIAIKRKIYQRADKIIAISTHSKNDLMNIYGIPEKKIHVIYHGIEAPLPEEASANPFLIDPGPYILYVGARTPYKNFDGLMKAFSRSKAKEDFILVAAGGSGFTSSEILLMKQLGIAHKILGFPNISQTELAWLYYHAHGMIYPSMYEGFGFPPLEAMSMACPTLASNSSCLPEVLGDGPLYFESGDEDDLADQLERLCYDKGLRAALIARGKEIVKKYTWDSTADNTIAAYKAALG